VRLEPDTAAWAAVERREVGQPLVESRARLTNASVIQRQLWLMEHGGLQKNQAYDTARKEFYALRHAEEVERRVAREEALWVGASFGKGLLEIGMGLEDKTYEGWKAWATSEIQAMERQRDAAYTGIGTKNADDVNLDAAAAAELEPEATEEAAAVQ
jgi:small subunit ribosomal protein S23